MITVLVCYERISLFHTMEPFFRKSFRGLFHFTQSVAYCLERDRNRILFMERWFQHRAPKDLGPEDLELMKKLRDKYDKIIFLNGQPEAGTNRLDLLPWVDRLFYKSVFTDRDNYRRDLYGKNLFADYYHRQFQVRDSREEYRYKPSLGAADTDRIELSWNIGVGDYPRRNLPQRLGTALARAGLPRTGRLFRTARSGGPKTPEDFSSPRRSIPVHARIDPVSSESISYQRRLCLEKTAGDGRFVTGLVSQDRYYRELAGSQIVLSPFGWGEVCFRDFEAVISGALLMKPDMSHLQTWPDIYIPWETYVPLNWDCSDLHEKTTALLADDRQRQRIARNAFDQYRTELSRLESRFSTLFADLLP